jgi:hypothetical protein
VEEESYKERGWEGGIWQIYYVFMYESGKIRPVETILRKGVKENDGGGEFN